MTMERKSRPWKAVPESMIIEDERGSVCVRLKKFKRHYVVVVGAVFSLDIRPSHSARIGIPANSAVANCII